MTKEQRYIAQLTALGVWDEAFKPAVEELATLERELSRARKQWKATAPEGKAPDVLDEHYAVICKLRAEILQHRESLGLTPKGLKRLRGKSPVQETETGTISNKLDALLEKVSGYE